MICYALNVYTLIANFMFLLPGLPDNKAWGSKRSKYYGDDDVGKKQGL